MKLFFVMLFALTASICALGQSNQGVNLYEDPFLSKQNFYELSIGPVILSNTDFFENTQIGFAMDFGFRHQIKNRKYSYTLKLGVSNISESVDGQANLAYNLLNFMPGFKNEFNLYESKNRLLNMAAVAEIAYSINSFALSYTPSDSRSETLYIFEGNTVTLFLGYILRYKYFFVEVGYHINNPIVTLTDDFQSELRSRGETFEVEQKTYLGNTKAKFGVSIPF